MQAAAYFWHMKANQRLTRDALLRGSWERAEWLALNESRLFFGALVMLLLPVWATEGWYTFDGPAHLYNAQLIGELLWGIDHPLLDSFYQLRWPPAPNLVYYLLAAPLSRILEAEWVDKLWASLHVLVFGLGFRFFLLQIVGGERFSPAGRLATWASWVGLYGVFHQHFFLGQYNFAMGVGLLWWTLGYSWRWLAGGGKQGAGGAVGGEVAVGDGVYEFRAKNKAGSRFSTLWPLSRMGGLLTLLGISHIVGFAAAGISLAVMLIWLQGRDRRRLLIHMLCLLAVSLPVLVINVHYLWHSSGTGTTRFIDFSDLALQWIRLEALTSFNPPVEWRPMASLFLLGILTLPLALLTTTRKQFRLTESRHTGGNAWAYLLTCAGLFLLMYFILPDESRNSGYLSSRLALIGQLFWLAGGVLLLGEVPRFVRHILIALLLLLLPVRVAYYWKVERSLGRDLSEIRVAAAEIPAASVVHQVNFSSNWMYEHLSMSVSGKDIIHLKNYEAYLDYFPVGWRNESIQPWMTHGHFWKNWPPCPDTTELERLTVPPLPDYLIVWDDGSQSDSRNTECRQRLNLWLEEHYQNHHVTRSRHCRILKRKIGIELPN